MLCRFFKFINPVHIISVTIKPLFRFVCAVEPVAVLGKNIGGRGWPLIIWEATVAKRSYYRTD